MRYIQKQAEPVEFTNWKIQEHHQDNVGWKPSYDKLSGKVKTVVKEALLTEQGYICCYCEQRLRNKNCHIEHLHPQSKSSTDDIDYSNLLCSCSPEVEEKYAANNKGGKRKQDRHCGHAKENKQLPTDPLQPDCQKKFTFAPDGHIYGVDEHATTTITILNLNFRGLIDRRKKAIDTVIFDIEEMNLNESEIKAYVHGYVQKSAEGGFEEFVSAIEYVGTRLI